MDSLQIPGRNDSEKPGYMLGLCCEPVKRKSKAYMQETLPRNEKAVCLCNDYIILLLQQR